MSQERVVSIDGKISAQEIMDWAKEWQKNVPMSGLDWTVYLADKINERFQKFLETQSAKVFVVIDTEEDDTFDSQNSIWGVYATYDKANKYAEDNLEQYDIEEHLVEGLYKSKEAKA